MYPSKLFHEIDRSILIERIRANPLAVIVGVDEAGAAKIAHAPVLVDQRDGGIFLRFHLARSNSVCAALTCSKKCLCVFTGPDAYISPDWYDVDDQVPTWNYLSVEGEGPVRVLGAEAFATFLDDLSAHFENDLAPKPPWTRDKMKPGLFDKMLHGIVGFEMTAERFEGTSKLNQNKTAEMRERVAAQLHPHPIAEAMGKLEK